MRQLTWILVLLLSGTPLAAQDVSETRAPADTLQDAADADATDAQAGDDAAHTVEPDGHVYFVAHFDELEFVAPRDGDDGVPMGTADDVIFADPQRRFDGDRIVSGTAGMRDPLFLQRAVLDGPGEVTVAPGTPGNAPDSAWRDRWGVPSPAANRLGLRLPEPRDVRGRVFVPNADWSGRLAVDFVVPADAFSPEARADWLAAVADSAAAHLDAQHTGAAWYRHQRNAALAALGGAGAVADALDDLRRRRADETGNLQREYELLSGTRAFSENLALDRVLPFAGDALADVPIAEIPGVSVNAYDWDELIDGLQPALDPLAALIPADQHALFFPTFEALVAVTDELDGLGAPLGRQFELRAESAGTRARYEHQLGLPMSELARLLGPHLIRSVAITGGDAYLRTGSDIAMLFEPREPMATFAAITARTSLSLSELPGVERVNGELDGQAYTGLRNADRSVCSYVARLDGAVVVTNSLVQLERLVHTSRGAEPALRDEPEYLFFRDRYALGDPDESALLILSDATIRRWCGPRLRIGSSRRARAAAVLSELTARAIDGPHEPFDGERNLGAPVDLPDAGPLRRAPTSVRSEAYGSLAFATPIAELDLEYVTIEEEALYTRWLQGYESNWRQVFDPIAVRIGVGGGDDGVGSGRLALDATVRPLIADSDYERFIEITQGGQIAPRSGDLHPGTLLHYSLAMDSHRLSMEPETGMLKVLAPGVDIFGWIGGSFSIYMDEAPFWDELLAAEDTDAFFDEHLAELPLALQVEVSNGFKLAAFLTTARAMIESSAPGMVGWENREHAGQTYVRVAELENQSGMDLALYYSTSAEQVSFSLSEALIQRVIDRHVARQAARESGAEPPAASEPVWLGEHMATRVDVPAVLTRVEGLTGGLLADMRRASWANLPILNEWRRRFPDVDPVRTHEAWFARTPTCPSGGEYRWNEAWQTMESTLYGHPGAPLDGPKLPGVLSRILSARLGTTFEDDGLRAYVEFLLTDPADG